MTDYEHLIYEQRGPVTIITINRPERLNAIGPQTPQLRERRAAFAGELAPFSAVNGRKS